MKLLRDTREQAPYTFDRYQGVTVERAALQTCDYSLAGLHVHWCGGRAGGEYMAYSLLQKFLAEQEGRLKALIKAHGDAA